MILYYHLPNIAELFYGKLSGILWVSIKYLINIAIYSIKICI